MIKLNTENLPVRSAFATGPALQQANWLVGQKITIYTAINLHQDEDHLKGPPK